MRRSDSRTMAVAGVLVAAVLASCLIQPAVGRLATLEGSWLAAAILGLPTIAVLVATSFRHYGWARSVAVAVAIMLITGVVSWVVSIFAVASALSASAISQFLTVLLYAVPAVLVLILGLLALKVVPGHRAADRQFEHVSNG